MREAQRLSQQGYRKEDRYQRINIAENGGFLAAQILERSEIEAIGNAGVQKTYNQKADPTCAVQGTQRNSAREAHIREQDKNGGKELQKGTLKAADRLNKFIEQNDGGIEAGGAEPKEDAEEMVAAGRKGADAGDQ